MDREIGLHYNTFRYCDWNIGRFIQPDLIGFLVGINLYQFDRLGLMHGEVIVLSIL
ncbi:RHS repeat domain-containing protein [Gilliamella apicola]|uniref:RHS repeat domain-containing protein n=1 Tax=Gilliamella apicola TaxID=1196095 RepID=UPI003987F323